MKLHFGPRAGHSPSRFNKTFRPQFESLEDRIALSANPVLPQTSSSAVDPGITVYQQPAAGIYYNPQTNELNIHGTNMADKAVISSQTIPSPDINTPPISITQITLGHYEDVNGEETFVSTHTLGLWQGVSKIVFHGYGGDDEFRNNTHIASTAFGGAGNDLLVGGAGDDLLYGGDDDDALYCMAGNDQAYGGDGNDHLYAGQDVDQLFGQNGDDVLVSIGGGQATLTGGAGNDSFWTSPGDSVLDASTWETNNGYLHDVAQFMGYTYDGGDTSTPVSLELSGQNFADPEAIVDEDNDPHLVNYADHPLFAAAGPANTDVDQGGVGDCYFVATLAAIADANPDFIRQMVVDLGESTYAVRFFRSGQEVYVRVDADLWTEAGFLEYAGFGADGAMWVAIVEKAYAFFRKELGTYASIASGNGTVPEHLNLTRTTWEIQDGVTPEEVIAWNAAGAPDGALKDTIHAGVIDLLNWVQDRLAAGKALITGARAGVGNGTAIQLDDPATDGNESTYRRGQHVYMIDSVLTDAAGDPIGLRLYNPYGSYVNLTNFTRLYFCIGRAQAWDVEPNTGLMLPGGDWQFEETTIPQPNPGDPYRTKFDQTTQQVNLARNAAFDDYEPTTIAVKPLSRDTAPRQSSASLAVIDASFDGKWDAFAAEMIF